MENFVENKWYDKKKVGYMVDIYNIMKTPRSFIIPRNLAFKLFLLDPWFKPRAKIVLTNVHKVRWTVQRAQNERKVHNRQRQSEIYANL